MGKLTNKMAEVEEKKSSDQEGVKIEPYKVFGRDFSLTDPDYIKYYKVRMKIMAVRYQLLGRVNNKGIYQIPAVIKHELVDMSKEIEDMDNDWYRASAVYMKKYYFFQIKLTMLENNMAKASLYLSEFVDDFLEDEYIVSHIADFVDVFDDEFRIKVRKAFNLVDVAVPMTDMQVPNIAVVIQDAIDLEMLVAGLYDIASQIYVLRMLKLLEGAGEQGQAIIRRYKELIIDKDENDINEKHKNTKFKSLLDRAIDEFGGVEKLNVNKEDLKDIVVEMNNSIKAITNMQNRPGAIEILKTDKGKDKVAGNKSSKSGGSSKPKKKEEKKSGKKDDKKKGGKDKKKDSGKEEKKGLFSYGYDKTSASKVEIKVTAKPETKPEEENSKEKKQAKESPKEENNKKQPEIDKYEKVDEDADFSLDDSAPEELSVDENLNTNDAKTLDNEENKEEIIAVNDFANDELNDETQKDISNVNDETENNLLEDVEQVEIYVDVKEIKSEQTNIYIEEDENDLEL